MNGIIEFLYTLIQVASAVMALLLGAGAMWLVFAYGRSIVEARTIMVSTVIFGAVILIAVGIGLRDYPGYLMRMATEGFNNLAAASPAFRESINNFASQTVDEMNAAAMGAETTYTISGTPTPDPYAGGFAPDEFPTAGPAPTDLFTATPTETPTSMPEITPTVDVVTLSTRNAALVTAVPTINPDVWNPMTPAPTPQPGG